MIIASSPDPTKDFKAWDEWRKKVCKKIDNMTPEERAKLVESIAVLNKLYE